MGYVHLSNGKIAVEWSQNSNEKPNVNQWYQMIDSDYIFWKIMKDYRCQETKTTYYKIVDYYNGDDIYHGCTLAECRRIIKENTYRQVV